MEIRFVIEPSNILFGGVYVCTFQPGNFTGWGSEGVKAITERDTDTVSSPTVSTRK